MFEDNLLKEHLTTSPTISVESLVIAEFNMNIPDNIEKVGNYRYRPTSNGIYKTIPINYDEYDSGNYYTNATDSDITIDGGTNNLEGPVLFTSNKDKNKIFYSLEDCLKPFRPRSGINKAIYLSNGRKNYQFLANSGSSMANRPRYYMSSRYDEFKYWTSYRVEDNIEYGIAKNVQNNKYFIEDTAPFVVYRDAVPTNRIVIKMQTNVGDVDLGPFKSTSGLFPDPLYGTFNKTTPTRWKIQGLIQKTWRDLLTIDESTLRDDGSAVIGSDGHVEIQYGLQAPAAYKNTFKLIDTISSTSLLPDESVNGHGYLVISEEYDIGELHVWNSSSSDYDIFVPTYGWSLSSDSIDSSTRFVTKFVNPERINNSIEDRNFFREFVLINGIRIVVETMNKFDSTFDLIELSPRLVCDISNNVIDFSITKSLSDLGSTSLPVGQLLASTGSINIFDDNQSLNSNNPRSILCNVIRKNIKFIFYEKILNVEGFDYFVPIKTLYSEGLPTSDFSAGTVSFSLRDLYFFLESMPAPSMLVTNASLSYAVSVLLDYIGLSNYSFKKLPQENDEIIPYFFIGKDQNVAEVLNQLAVSTQSAMFFDEYNNFIVMSKNYLMPSQNEREVDIILSGNNNQEESGTIKNAPSGILPNIIGITSEDKTIFNDGKISYTTRYIQRSYGSVNQYGLADREKSWVYKPVLLWESAGDELVKTVNDQVSKQNTYILSAMPINSNLSDSVPSVQNNKIINNVIDFGENVYWLGRYNGYFFSNGEIIRFDAVQFNITLPVWYRINPDGSLDESSPEIVLPGRSAPVEIVSDLDILEWRQTHRQGSSNVWISNNQQYQKYFSQIPFNGKIYPTGLVRIYVEPYYETIDSISKIKNGAVYKHGRGQFGTPVSSHFAGIPQHWTNNANVRGCLMDASYLFSVLEEPALKASLPATEIGNAGKGDGGTASNALARQSFRNGIIKNFISPSNLSETDISKMSNTSTGTVQSSALVISGPAFKTTDTPLNFLSYVCKDLTEPYRHFGTRMRIIGKIENNENRNQTPIGSTPYYQIGGVSPNQNITVAGGSGGIAFMLNSDTNNGYYFEIVAMTEANIESYLGIANTGVSNVPIHNVMFYKVKKEVGSNKAIPVKLWGGLAKIITDDGLFTGQYRVTNEEHPTVYDLAVEYEDIGKIRRFYLYINNKLIKIVDDEDPLPKYNNLALFVRGAAKCMFENVYALSENYSQNTEFPIGDSVSKVFGDSSIDVSDALRKYSMSGMIKSTYLSGISSQSSPKYNMYFDEFGAIMRECSYFNIKYDRAYPALYAQLAPTVNRIKGYTTSGFYADSYGAEFLIFNNTDTALSLDETSGNYLRILGIAFTQDTTYELTVDDYFKTKSILLESELSIDNTRTSFFAEQEKYNLIKISRMAYGKNEFSIDAPYIQTQDAAENLMGWIIKKIMVPKKSIGTQLFAIPTLQLGDIVTIDYKDSNGNYIVTGPQTRFVVYNIEYEKQSGGPSMTAYLSEV